MRVGPVATSCTAPFARSRHAGRCRRSRATENGRDLHVSSGLGCSIAPVRFGVPPQIALLELG